MKLKYLTLIIVLATVFVSSCTQTVPKSNESTQASSESTQERIEQKFCNTADDCVLRSCIGCVNKEWAELAPPEPPCMRFGNYTGCECVDNKCVEI